jgi:hypothetical protein
VWLLRHRRESSNFIQELQPRAKPFAGWCVGPTLGEKTKKGGSTILRRWGGYVGGSYRPTLSMYISEPTATNFYLYWIFLSETAAAGDACTDAAGAK